MTDTITARPVSPACLAPSGPASALDEEPISKILGGMYGQGAWTKRSLAQAFCEARLALGQRMYRAGIDDGTLGGQIRDLDERINRPTATRAPSKALKVQQKKLILQLADAALAEEGPLPGADAEYRRAREAQAALDRHEKGVDARRTACPD